MATIIVIGQTVSEAVSADIIVTTVPAAIFMTGDTGQVKERVGCRLQRAAVTGEWIDELDDHWPTPRPVVLTLTKSIYPIKLPGTYRVLKPATAGDVGVYLSSQTE